MADKTISIKLLVDREKEFKNSLQQIGSEMKLLSAEAKKLQAQYAEEANTYDALSAKSKNLGAQYDELTKKLEEQKKALENQRELKKQYEAQTESLAKKAKEAAEAYKNAAEKTDKLKDAMREAKNAVNQNAQNIEKAESRAKTYTRQITETETAQILLGRELDKTNMYLQEAATSADGTAHSIDKYGNKVKDAAEDTKSFADIAETIAQVLAASGLAMGVEKLTELIIDCTKASIQFESAFAGVKKTVDGTEEELEDISDGIKELATVIPLTTTELAKIAETAGQLGIAKGDILTFTEVVANLAATTDLTAEEAAVSLARIANITGLMTSEYKNFGSTLVDLGNNSAAFESEILEMTNRLAGTGSIVEATNAQLLGVATTLVSLGIEAEAGGTAFSKLLTNIELAVETGSDQLQQYAEIAGMSVKQFSDAWRNDAVKAVSAFIDGLGGLKSEGQSAIVVLDDMGISEVRLRDTILKLTEADGLLTENLNRSNAAWADNNALTEEAEKRYETTESKITLAKTAIDNLKITIGDELLEQFDGFIGKFTDLVTECEKFIKLNPDVITGITTLKKALGINDELNAVGDAADDLVDKLQGLKKEYTETSDAAEKMSVLSETESTYKKLSEAIDEYDGKLAESREKLAELREEQKKLLETQNETYAQEMAAAEQAAGLQLQIDAELENIRTYISARNTLGEQRRQTAEDLAVWRDECVAAAVAVEEVGTTTTEVSEEIATAGDKIEETGKKAVTSTKATKEATDEAGKAIIEHAKTVKANLETLSKEYDSAYKSAQSALGGIGGLFGEVAFESDKSISDMLKGLDSQADYFTGYMLNLQRASQIGIDEGLVAALADGSKQSAGHLQVIIDEFNKVAVKYGENSEEAEAFVTDFNTKFEATSKAKDALAATMAGIQTNFEERAGDILTQADNLITELSGYSGNAYDEVSKAVSETLTDIADGFTKFQVAAQEKSQGIIDAALHIKQGINTTLEVLPEEMKVAGQNVSLGLAEGILDKAGELEAVVRNLARETIINATRDELGIHSPSEEGREIGEFYDEGIGGGIKDKAYVVIDGMLYMINKLESASQSAAAAAGRSLGNTMAKSMTEALRAGQALRQQVESGTLTVDGKVVQTAASVGIPSLTGQAAIDFNNEMKDFHNLPSDWSNQDIVDWLNGGGFHGGTSSSTQAAIDSALKNESAGKVSLTQTTNKAWHDSYVNQLNANKSKSGSSGTTVVVNQEIHSQLTPYQLQTMSEKGVQNALQKI